jgi:hypothetical protein
MGSHPVNLILRFLLEVVALFAMGAWGWFQGNGWLRFLLAIGLPVVAAILWGTFAVLNDPSRSGKAPVVIPGVLRLILELGFFAFAAWGIYDLGYVGLSAVFGIIVAVHYLVSYDRVRWLLKQ